MAVHFYFGRTGSGKSFRAKKELAKFKRKIVFDPSGSFEAKNAFYVSNYTNLQPAFNHAFSKKEFCIVFTPDLSKDLRESANIVAKFAIFVGSLRKELHKRKHGNKPISELPELEKIALFFDELDKYKITTDLVKGEQNYLKTSIEMGRHYDLSLHCISQVPSSLPKYFKDNASSIFAFKLGENEFYKKYFGEEKSNELAYGMKDYHAYLWQDGKDIRLVKPN